MPFRFSKSSNNRLLGVDPDIFRVARLAIQITKIDFGIPLHGGLRTQAEQNELFHAGLSKCDGYEKISSHQTGEALDVYAFVDALSNCLYDPPPNAYTCPAASIAFLSS